MSVETGAGDSIILDLGTGLRQLGCSLSGASPYRGTALVSHLHWDHVQGLPFFAPLLRPGSSLAIYGPRQEDGRLLEDAFEDFMRPPYFPITLKQLPAAIGITECPMMPFHVGAARITAREIPHIGATLGFRIEADGVAIAYLPDHQQPCDGSSWVDPAVLDLCRNADLIIHDAQFTDAEFAERSNWGHCTVNYAVEVAIQSGARQLALFHHDPSHSDDQIESMLAEAVLVGRKAGVAVIAASEGLQVDVAPARYAQAS